MAEGEVGAVAPVETVPGTQPVSAPAAPVGGNEAPPSGDQPVKPPRTYSEEEVRKITSDRLSKERKRLARDARTEVERDFYRDLAANPSRQAPVTDKPQGKSKPLAKDFADVDSYIDAVTDWKLEQREAKQRQEAQEREPRERQANSQAEYARSLTEKLSSGAEKFDDFEEHVFADGVPFTDPVVAAIHESDMPADLAYYLATHVDELKRIAKLPSTRQAAEVVKLEDKLKAPPKPTGAPPPIVPGGGSAGATKDLAHMTPAEHVAAYRRSKRK